MILTETNYSESFGTINKEDQGKSIDELIVDLYELQLSHLQESHTLDIKMARAEHDAIVNENEALLNEAVQAYTEAAMDTLKRWWEAIKAKFNSMLQKFLDLFRNKSKWFQENKDGIKAGFETDEFKKKEFKSSDNIFTNFHHEGQGYLNLDKVANTQQIKDEILGKDKTFKGSDLKYNVVAGVLDNGPKELENVKKFLKTAEGVVKNLEKGETYTGERSSDTIKAKNYVNFMTVKVQVIQKALSLSISAAKAALSSAPKAEKASADFGILANY